MMSNLYLSLSFYFQFLNYHMLGQVVYTSGIQPELRYRFSTLTGDWLDLKKGGEADDPILVNGEARILERDREAENGVIHVIDKVLDCPCLRNIRSEATIPP